MLFHKGFALVILILMGLTSFAFSGEMTRVENFTLKDYNGEEHSLADYQEFKAIVLMFIATQCPVSNAYNTRMVELYGDYQEKNIAFHHFH